ncbi:RNA-directed DNA polymerase from mobile element jockey [Labeo rohita]|uniref:RNA-directed DNA polymerase from mobile element jockey n=1 Tax=Labeo rohita TaxID=84645 RepID=A0ABQ8L2Q7_LABRO|nr:RNA-directed DNA polymerase from mobile element jockey [Labeo rohita]
MSGTLAPGRHWTMVAGVSIFTFRTIESPITKALSSGFSVGASLSGENLFNVLIGTEEWCFDPRLCRLTVTQLPCCKGEVTGTEQCTELPELVTSKAVSKALTFLLSSIKVWMRVSSSEIFSVSLTISLHLSHVNPLLPTEIDKLCIWQKNEAPGSYKRTPLCSTGHRTNGAREHGRQTNETERVLQACFECTDWSVFEAAANDLDELTETVTSYISFCEDICIPTRTYLTFNNDKPWFTAKLVCRHLRQAKEDAYRKGDRVLYNQARNTLNKRLEWLKGPMQKATPLSPPPLQISENDVRQVLRKNKRRKAPGSDSVTPACLKTCADQLAPIFSQIFNRSLELCEVPSCFKRSTIIPVPKKTKIAGLNDYRPVALMSVIMKSFEKLVLAYLKNITGPLLDSLQFAYQTNRSVDDAVNMGLHFILQHLARPRTHVRILFVDFSSAFNTIIPALVQTNLNQLSVPSYISQWITSFLTDRQQLLLKFADDTTLISLIQDGEESAYRQEVKELAVWCRHNNLELNTLKTVEMIVDFRRNPPALSPLTLMDSTVATVETFKFLGSVISQDLKWDTPCYKIRHQKITENGSDYQEDYWFSPAHPSRTIFIQSEEKSSENHSGSLASKSSSLLTFTIWSAL